MSYDNSCLVYLIDIGCIIEFEVKLQWFKGDGIVCIQC